MTRLLMFIFLCVVLKSSAKQNTRIMERLKPFFDSVGNAIHNRPDESELGDNYDYEDNTDYDDDKDDVDEELVEGMVEAAVYRNALIDSKKSCRKQCPKHG